MPDSIQCLPTKLISLGQASLRIFVTCHGELGGSGRKVVTSGRIVCYLTQQQRPSRADGKVQLSQNKQDANYRRATLPSHNICGRHDVTKTKVEKEIVSTHLARRRRSRDTRA